VAVSGRQARDYSRISRRTSTGVSRLLRCERRATTCRKAQTRFRHGAGKALELLRAHKPLHRQVLSALVRGYWPIVTMSTRGLVEIAEHVQHPSSPSGPKPHHQPGFV